MDLDTAKQHLDEIHGFNTLRNDLKAKIAPIKQFIDTLGLANDDLQTQVTNHVATIATRDQELQQQTEATQALQIQNTDLNNELAALRQQLQEQQDKNVKLEADLATTKLQVDTLVVNKNTKYDLLRSTQFQTPYVGNIASENLKYTGVLPQKLLDFDVTVVPTSILPNGTAILLQRNVTGFIADEIPLNATALYREEPKKLWRADVQRVSAIGIDQPKSACVITGI